ncbi:L-aspartate oxidase [Arthrobacter agilis]|uniref:L-aspartate oxidase n=1 Tax=Arthrobacter agilis TaxID=37921 RepID=UPI000B35691B|nr:L-aspartate oxidase [Arthrobacter agilis]OUM44131.1 L-aspartate oxidase [Arthrobacter agilis]PPB46506.1 L-aspartate oxidase [Arthrobacter agilis]TPV23838.1 L-aspartate oxidase [Arthrobacter agilis]VDR32574.1 L-aspartate oxidase [Arthrobacter agilis]
MRRPTDGGTTQHRRTVVVGAGIAGLQTVLALRRLDPDAEVVLVSKTSLAESNTRYAQGGIAAVVPPAAGGNEAAGGQDSVAAHVADTLVAGAGLSDATAAAVLCAGAADAIAGLERDGVVFDRTEDGREPARGREAAHSAPRILHLGGDATGAGLVATLTAAVRDDPGVRILEDTVVARILQSYGHGQRRAVGVALVSGAGAWDLAADAVVLATGGAGQLFAHTTNPAIATGDGVALAWQAGAAVADLEFFQFHPTALDVPGHPLISEAVRGEGALLVGADGQPFMRHHHPDGDLAPRDVVSRGIATHLMRDAGVPGPGPLDDPPRTAVYLDATALGAPFLARRFPSLSALTSRHGFDWAAHPVPVVPAAHYWMGGVCTDTDGRTSVPGLFAVGEVARTGVHGANRLASNSLLEAVVFADRCAAAIASGVQRTPVFDVEPLDLDAAAAPTQSFTRRDLQHLMSDHAGVLRTGAGLGLAAKHLASYRAADDAELANLLLCARLLVHAALHRPDSCGAHFRVDRAAGPEGPPAPSMFYVRATEGAA